MNEVYVAVNGCDTWPGTCARPFATLERARDTIREMKRAGGMPEGGVTVWIRGRVYPRLHSFLLTAEDSGTAESPVIYRGYREEPVRLVGGTRIAGFSPVTERVVLERLSPEARGNVVQTDLAAEGVTDLGKLSSRGFGRPIKPSHLQVFFRGEAMWLARWPNDGFSYIAGVPEQPLLNDGHGGALGALENGFHYEGDRPKRWKQADDIWVHGYWAWDWANSYERVGCIDTERRLIKTVAPYGHYGFRPGQRFYFLNILEELDQPGEYYVDTTGGILYFWPPAAVEEGEVYVSVLEQPMVIMRDASYITIRDLTLEVTRGTAVEVSGGSRNLVGGCTMRHIGNSAVVINGGNEHGVVGCDILDTGDGGISLNGGDRRMLSRAGHYALNNHIHHVAQWSRCYQPAVRVNGVGHWVARNLIHDGPHCAILLSGNDHLVELNEIHHFCHETGDVGAFYLGRDWTERGNVVRYNFFHDLGGVGIGSQAVYLDDCASGTTVYGNIFWRTQRAVLIGGGRDNLIENNVFYNCGQGVHVDGRGLDERPVWRNMVYETMRHSLEATNYEQPPYSERYPQLLSLGKYYEEGRGIPPENNVIRRNLSVGGQWLEVVWHAKPEMLEISDNLVDVDPHFVEPGPEPVGFELKDDSPAFQLGFQRLPLDRIGLHEDEYRKQVPERISHLEGLACSERRVED